MTEAAKPSAIRGLLDSNAVDLLVYPPERYEAMRDAVDDGRLVLLWTHITIDELAAIPDLERRGRLLLTAISLARLVPTGAMVLDYSRWDWARLADDEEAVEAFRQGNLRHTRDALLAATAVYERCALVTADRTLTFRARARGVEVMTPDDLAARLA